MTQPLVRIWNEFSGQRSSIISSRSARNYQFIILQVSTSLIATTFFYCCHMFLLLLWGSLTQKENSSDTYLGTSLSAPSTKEILNLLTISTGIVLSLL